MGLEVGAIAAIVGAASAVAGAGISGYAAVESSNANRKQMAAQRRAEEARRQQMNLDATRRRREMLRQAQVARAQAVSTASNQGASEGSGLAGALGQIEGQTGSNILGLNQNQELGNRIFDANALASTYAQQAASANAFGAVGSQLQSLGGSLIKNEGLINKFGTYFSSPKTQGQSFSGIY